jgi:hypothetical protein
MLSPGDPEVKRMFVMLESRGKDGLASTVLQELEERARSRDGERQILYNYLSRSHLHPS